jgi:hypothetical protein
VEEKDDDQAGWKGEEDEEKESEDSGGRERDVTTALELVRGDGRWTLFGVRLSRCLSGGHCPFGRSQEAKKDHEKIRQH